jgi:MFS family permease
MTTVTQPQSESGHRAHLGWALALITVAQLMVVLDATIANIALPYIQEDLGFTNAGLTWVVTGYALAFGSLLLLGGRLGDLYGRRRIFMIGPSSSSPSPLCSAAWRRASRCYSPLAHFRAWAPRWPRPPRWR